MKTTQFFFGAVVLAGLIAIAGIAGSAYARGGGGGGMGMGMGMGCANSAVYNALTPEKQAKLDAIYSEADARIQPLKDKAWAKDTELRALAVNPNTKPETISKLSSELADLRVQIRKEYTALDDRLEKEVGVNPGYGRMSHRGMGHGGMMGGPGMGYGHGYMHGGQAPQNDQ